MERENKQGDYLDKIDKKIREINYSKEVDQEKKDMLSEKKEKANEMMKFFFFLIKYLHNPGSMEI